MEIEFSAEAAKGQWDDIEVSQVYENLKEGYCERIDDEEMLQEATSEGHEVFWSVYLHQVEGGVQCVADLPTKELADQLARLIDEVSKSRIYII